MNTDKLYDLYRNNLKNILNPYMLATISDRSYDIHGFNLINRLLIYIQNKYTTSLKSDSGWYVAGREVKSKSSPIWVIENVIKTEYIDPETSEIIHDLDLNANDIAQAVKLGVIDKSKTTTGLKSVPLYNIKDTTIFDKNTYRMYMANEKTNIKVSTLLKIAVAEFGIMCKQSNSSYYDFEEDITYIGKDGADNKINAIADAIAYSVNFDALIDNELKDSINEESLHIMYNLCRSFIHESIVSYCNKEYSVENTVYTSINELEFSKQENIDAIMTLLAASYDFVEELICIINPDNHKISESSLRKAAELLNILEANDAIMQLRG